jgi:hypothetical protein
MHFMISWEINASGHAWTTLDDKMKGKLAQHSWVHVLKTTYVVQVQSQTAWDSIHNELVNLCKANPGITFIMTPLINGGAYNGMLPPNLWDEINKRSQ